MNAYFVFFPYFEETIPQKDAYTVLISNNCIYACLININQLLWDAVLVNFSVIPRY